MRSAERQLFEMPIRINACFLEFPPCNHPSAEGSLVDSCKRMALEIIQGGNIVIISPAENAPTEMGRIALRCQPFQSNHPAHAIEVLQLHIDIRVCDYKIDLVVFYCWRDFPEV